MFPSRPHCPPHDDSLGAIIKLCLSLNWTQGSNTNHTIIFSGTATVCPKTKRKNWGCSQPNENAMPSGEARSSSSPSPSPPPPLVNWSVLFLQIFFLNNSYFFSVRRLDSGRWHLCLCLQGRARACLASHVLHLLLLPGQKNKYIFLGENTLSKICVFWDDLSRH